MDVCPYNERTNTYFEFLNAFVFGVLLHSKFKILLFNIIYNTTKIIFVTQKSNFNKCKFILLLHDIIFVQKKVAKHLENALRLYFNFEEKTIEQFNNQTIMITA